MERVVYKGSTIGAGAFRVNVLSISKPPWSHKAHSGKLERLILQLGAGRGRFSEVEGIPRSIGCIGNNRFLLRREPLSPERVKELIKEFHSLGGKELWLTNYDSVEYLLSVALYSAEIGVPEVYAVVMFEDLDKVSPVEGVRFIAEFDYSKERMEALSAYPWLHGALVMVMPEELDELHTLTVNFTGEIYVDVLYPGSARRLDFNVIDLRRVLNPTNEKYHDCLAGTIAVTADGYLLPCPLLRNYVVVDLRESGLKEALRKKKLRRFWKMTKDTIPACSKCPFRYLCHDCRALEYQATGEIDGMEFCPMLL